MRRDSSANSTILMSLQICQSASKPMMRIPRRETINILPVCKDRCLFADVWRVRYNKTSRTLTFLRRSMPTCNRSRNDMSPQDDGFGTSLDAPCSAGTAGADDDADLAKTLCSCRR